MRRLFASSSSALKLSLLRSFITFPDLKKPAGAPAALPPLDYPVEEGVYQFLSAKQLNLHYNKHHKAYVDKLNQISGTKYDGKTIEEIVVESSKVPEEKVLFNQAAQHFNHSFYWKCLCPRGTPLPDQSPLRKAIDAEFGSLNDFIAKFNDSGVGNFGSGWTWLVYNTKTKKLSIENTGNAFCPITNPDAVPILTADVWEHAYYVDYENRRPDYLKEIWKSVNWNFAISQFEKASA